MKPFQARRIGVPPKPSALPGDAADLRGVELMGELLDLGVTPERAAETMSLLEKRRSVFVTELVKADREWTAEREAKAAADPLPDFLTPGAPDKPDVPASHSLNLRTRPGVRRNG